MALDWKDKVDGEDWVLAEDINAIAKAVRVVENKKLDKITDVSQAGNFGGAYILNKDGTQGMTPISNTTDGGTIPVRETGGAVVVGTPTADSHAASKGYVDDLAATKIDEWEGVAGGYLTYRGRMTYPDGRIETRFVRAYTTPIENAISVWNSKKQLSTEAPTGEKHCTNKEYVDDGDIAIKKRLDLLELAAEGNIFAFVEDDSAAYEKAVPATAFPNATIDKLGGAMGRDEYGLLTESPVTAIENHGKNLFNESAITQAANSKAAVSPAYGIVENGYLRAMYGAHGTSVLWLPFKMHLDVGKYTVSADVYVGSSAPNLIVYMGLSAGTEATNLKRNYFECSAYDMWERKTVTVEITESGDYFFTGCGKGAPENFTNLDVRFKNIQVEKADTATDFAPYRAPITIYEIPQAIRNLDGYGIGISNTVNNYIDFERKLFVRMCAQRMWQEGDEENTEILTDAVTSVYPLDVVETVDISAMLTFDGEIEVEANGAIVAVNEYEAAIPSTITYQVKI